MQRIRRLSPSLVNKIAAGEVIERPASVVKELLENAVDARARRIDVVVQQGGTELIRIVDDGEGIAADDLPLATASHATSKLLEPDDLFHIGTLGFRGEALASIAEISHLTIRSRPSEQIAGAELRVEGGVARDIEPCSCAAGTTVEVANLFFNTPVRRKFLRSSQTETGHLLEAFTRLALVHEEIHFTFQHNERTVLDLPPTDSWRNRVRALCGDEIADNLLAVDRTLDAVRLHGFAVHPAVTRGSNRSQYIFLNRRHIRDRSLGHALSEAYRGLILSGRYPACFLRIDMPANLVDVNVHPTKTEVRFVDAGGLYSLVLGALRSEFLRCDLTVRGRAENSVHRSGPAEWMNSGRETDSDRRDQINLWTRPSGHETLRAPGTVAWGSSRTGPGVPPFQPFDAFSNRTVPIVTEPLVAEGDVGMVNSPAGSFGAMAGMAPAMQVCNRYLVTESEDGLMVIDQHALHERVLYEELKSKVGTGPLEQQRLLVPEPVELSPAEASLVLEHRDVLVELGMDIEPFSGSTLVVMSYPAMLANLGPADILHRIAELLADRGATLDRGQLLDNLLHMIACKAAIKAGDRLTAQEVSSLIELRHLVHDAHHCPHGRPSTLVFTRAELDRQFRRT